MASVKDAPFTVEPALTASLATFASMVLTSTIAQTPASVPLPILCQPGSKDVSHAATIAPIVSMLTSAKSVKNLSKWIHKASVPHAQKTHTISRKRKCAESA